MGASRLQRNGAGCGLPLARGSICGKTRNRIMNRKRIPYAFPLLLALLVHTPLFAQWVETGYGVFRGGLVSVYSDGTVLLAGTGGGGIYVSGNNGSSWHVSNNGMPSEAPTSLGSLRGHAFVVNPDGNYVSAGYSA